MDLTAEQFEDLLGAYALDACEPDEVEALDRYVASHPEAAAEVERLRDVAAGLGAAGASRPPVDLRGTGSSRPRPNGSPRSTPTSRSKPKPSGSNARFLGTIDDGDLDAVTHNGLTVHELVQHVEALDRAFVTAAADPNSAFIGAAEVETITERELPEHRDEDFAQTVTRFRSTRARLVALHEELPADQRIAGYKRDDTLVIRVFETWTHHDDIERALDRPVTQPDARSCARWPSSR